MSKPTTKADLQAEAEQERSALLATLRALTPEQQTRPIMGEWSAKDILAHLAAWNQMMLGWIEASRQGKTPAVPAPGFTWGQLNALNQQIYEKNRDRTLEEIEAELLRSDEHARAMIEALDEADIFRPGLYPWMNKNALVTYFHANMGGHYAWALKEIKRGAKARK